MSGMLTPTIASALTNQVDAFETPKSKREHITKTCSAEHVAKRRRII